MTPPNPSPATADKQILTREDLLPIQLEHETSYYQLEMFTWRWLCRCGENSTLKNHEECHVHTREHWADCVLALLAPKLAKHAKLVQAAAIEAAKQMADAAEMLWTVVANVSEGDWTKQNKMWQEAAARWRDNYFEAYKRIAELTAKAQPEKETHD